MSVPFPEGKFGAILADCPWHFDYWSGLGTARAAENHYETMTDAEIRALPIASFAADDCALFLWATMPMLPEALQVMAAWSFEYKTVAFAWVKVLADNPRKPRLGLGYWTRANAELCLLGTRGSPKRLHRDVSQVIAEPIREHSRKPDCVHERIERLVAGPYIELFGRAPWPGWQVWGDEPAKFADPQQALALGDEP